MSLKHVTVLFHEGFGWWYGGGWTVLKNLVLGFARKGVPLEYRTKQPGGLPSRETVDGVPVRRYEPTPAGIDNLSDDVLSVGAEVLTELLGEVGLKDAVASSVSEMISNLSTEGVPESVIEYLSLGLKMIDNLEPGTIVHGNSRSTSFGGLVAKRLGHKFVFTPHSLEAPRPWKRAYLGEKGFLLSKGIEKKSFMEADAITAVSKVDAQGFAEHYEVSGQVKVIYNGVDEGIFHPVSKEETKKVVDRYNIRQPYVFYIGRVARQKDIPHLIESSRKFPEEVSTVLVLGKEDSPETLREVEDSLNAIGRERCIVIREVLTEKDLRALYSGALAFCSPSVWESFGLTFLEAAACGTPVVATKTGILAELEPTWFSLVPFNDSEAIAREVGRLFRDIGLREHMSKEGLKAVKSFTWENTVDAYLNLYEEIS